VSRNINILRTKLKNLIWVLFITTQILQELAFEPFFYNNAPLLKGEGRSKLTSPKNRPIIFAKIIGRL
jgi:hypothetical protein